MNPSQNKRYVLFGIVLVVIASAFYYLGRTTGSPLVVADSNVSSQDNSLKPKATKNINKSYTFPLKNDAGAEIGQIKYTIQSAELDDTILVKGQKATAVSGKTFLIFNIKVANDGNQGFQLNSRDYVRISTDGKEWLAADIHNDPVDIQPISTKITRIGFPIDNSNKKIKVQVGEIQGTKKAASILTSNLYIFSQQICVSKNPKSMSS